jgi:ribosome biogenesis GTPase
MAKWPPAACKHSKNRLMQDKSTCPCRQSIKNMRQPRDSFRGWRYLLGKGFTITGITAMKKKYVELNFRNLNGLSDSRTQYESSTGTIYKVIAGIYTVHKDGCLITCQLSSQMRQQVAAQLGRARSSRPGQRSQRANMPQGPLVVGDIVRLNQQADGTAFIQEVLPRRNHLSRRSAVPMPTAHAHEQVIAANVDQVVPVFASANPAPKWNLLDRYLALAESLDLPALIVITKLDLVHDPAGKVADELLASVEPYQRIGYPVLLTSAITGQGLDQLRLALQSGLSVLLGKSGVGKTALLNALQPGLGLRVNEVSHATGKGKHTTSHMEIFPLVSGGALVDTPGVREFGLWDLDDEELAYFYREMRPYIGHCRFRLDCAHIEEPGCAIRQAVTCGKISPHRYQSYLRLKDELA